ncbi:MAG: hypothetical protein AABW49_02975 [Nanoarchaeota archaeon]
MEQRDEDVIKVDFNNLPECFKVTVNNNEIDLNVLGITAERARFAVTNVGSSPRMVADVRFGDNAKMADLEGNGEYDILISYYQDEKQEYELNFSKIKPNPSWSERFSEWILDVFSPH